MNFRLLLLLAAVTTTGCQDYALEKGAPSEDRDESGTDAQDTAEGDTASDAVLPDGWFPWAIQPILEGVPVADGATIDLVFVDSASGEEACVAGVDPSGLVAAEAPEAEIWTWWEGPVALLDDACSGVPTTLGLGIGELHPDVRARLGADGYDDVADALFGAYVRIDGGAVWTFGYAGTESDFAGGESAASPVPDGAYTLVALYLLELPDSM